MCEGPRKRFGAWGMTGTISTRVRNRQARSDMLALKPYWGKPDVRNFREGDGNVGIIRSPISAIALPDRLTNSLGNSRVITFEVIVLFARFRYPLARCWITPRPRG